MKNFIPVSLALLSISTSGCASLTKQSQPYTGRLIEFKSDASGFDTRTFFYEGEHEVVAFDSQFTPDIAKKSIQYLRTFTKKPITWLIITHPNPDKFNGAAVFKKEGAQIVASKATAQAIPSTHSYKEYFFVEMAKMFKKEEYPQPTPVDQTFDDQMNLVLRGGEVISLYKLPHPGVSSTQTVAYIESIKSLIVGDLIHVKAHAWLEGGIINGKPTPSIDGWIKDLHELDRQFPQNTIVYGGRGITAPLNAASKEQIAYLKTAQKLIRNMLQELGPNAKEFLGPNANQYYKILGSKFQAQFPDYALPYMIEYGAYGLVQKELENLKRNSY